MARKPKPRNDGLVNLAFRVTEEEREAFHTAARRWALETQQPMIVANRPAVAFFRVLVKRAVK